MNRLLLLLAALVATFAIACGGGDKKDNSRDDDRPAATAEASDEAEPGDADEASDQDEPSDEASSDDDGGNPAGFLSPLFNLGLGGATGSGPAGLPNVQMGGELEQYLLTAGQLPAGYQNIMTFSMAMPADPANDFPGGDAAMAMWAKGDMTSATMPTDLSMLMLMVMQPDDPDAFEEFAGSCDDLSEDAFTEGLGGDNSFLGIEFKDFETLDSSGLGDQACGIGLTMDMSGFFEGLQEGFGEDLGEDVPPEVLEAFSNFRMRMRMFGEGDKMGMVMQVAFGAEADLADDLSIAQDLRANLQ